MIHLVMPEHYGMCTEKLAQMYRLRYRVFKQRLGWDVAVTGGMEVDAFDALHPAYLLQRPPGGPVQGCVRLLPTTGPTMLRETFTPLLTGLPAPASPSVWESSRFALEVPHDAPRAAHGLATATYELLAAMLEFGLAQNLSEIVTVTDVRMERILRRAGWPLRRFGMARTIGTTLAVAGGLTISPATLHALREAGGFEGPLIRTPEGCAAL